MFYYNKLGQMTGMGESGAAAEVEFEYDAFGRMRRVIVNQTQLAEFRYNGLGFRIAEQRQGQDWKYFCHNERWQVVAVYDDEDSDAEMVYVHHAAGLNGLGGSSYIDSLILRDRDTNGDGSMDQRIYYCNNWRSEPAVILNEQGSLLEWVRYTAYGEPISLPAGDTDSDFAWDEDDEDRIADFIENGGTYDVRLNPTLTGTVSAADITHANSITGGHQTLGRGVLSSTGVENRIGYAGYKYDPHLAGAGRHLHHVRHRVYMAHIGRWMTRDPLGYVDGMSLYQYVRGRPLVGVDPMGLVTACSVDTSVAAVRTCDTGTSTGAAMLMMGLTVAGGGGCGNGGEPSVPCAACITVQCCELCCATFADPASCFAQCRDRVDPRPDPEPDPCDYVLDPVPPAAACLNRCREACEECCRNRRTINNSNCNKMMRCLHSRCRQGDDNCVRAALRFFELCIRHNEPDLPAEDCDIRCWLNAPCFLGLAEE